MCVASMIYDHYSDKWQKLLNPPPTITWPDTNPPPMPNITPNRQGQLPSPEEIAEFYELLKKAREYDKKHNEPECELESKKEKLRILAEELGVKIEFV